MAQTVEPIPGFINPAIGDVAISDGSNINLTIKGIIRYNGTGKFTCAVTDNATFNGTMDVYWSTANNRFQAKQYIPTRYADEDGVKKGL